MRTRTLPGKRAQRGFTLFEFALATLLLGVIVVAIVPGLRLGFMASSRTYVEQQTTINQKIADALVAQASASALRSLPTPYGNSGNRVYSAVANPALTTGLAAELLARGVAPTQFNDDGSDAQKVRVYQRATGVALLWVPLPGIPGPTVDLDFDYGLVYLTDCPKSKTTCNASAHPRASNGTAHTTLTKANYNTWAALASDVAVTPVSTLPVHRRLLEQLGNNLLVLRDTFKGHSKTWDRVCANAAYNDGGGHYVSTSSMPGPPCLSSTADDLWGAWHMGGGVSANQANMGCWDGWYMLDPSHAGGGGFQAGGLLTWLGLDVTKYGRTPWGGTIEYCADYEPRAAQDSSIDTAPHYAAVRFKRRVTFGEVGTMDGMAESDVVIISW